MQSPAKAASFALAAIGLSLAAATPAGAATTATWSCRGSAVELQVANNSRVAPIVSDHSPCSDGVVGVPNVGEAIGIAPLVTARTAYASTSAKPPTVFPKDQTTAASAGVEGLQVKLFDGALTIGVDAAQTSVTGTCRSGTPSITGTSQVAKVTINGQEIALDGLLSAIVDPISKSPLGRVVQVKLNEEVKDATGLTKRAVHVIVLEGAAGSNPLVDLVVAESRLTSASACDPNAINNGGGNTTGSGTGDGNGLPQVCPTGSTLDLGRGLCVITAAASGGQGVVVVGVPYSGPSGGRVISLVNARKRYKSACLSGPGPKFVTVGTNRRDRITGTNRDDRILGLGGNDAIDGGRLEDCIDGGTGGDNLAGGIGDDKVLGMSGKDALNGGPGADALDGGAGNDTINAAFGQDRVKGGSGVDFINVATAGKAARVDCGSGRDKVRFNRNERRTTKNCETRYELRD
ncbi:MAG: calcium-binding protein [Solirubrobacterales bacterium]|jgi:Ca2+-binding RTX toxin-like protein|nr:calcium-binding protein [Solirubrobacterales bacterium]